MRFGRVASDPQPNAEATEMLVRNGALEPTEDAFLVSGVDPDSVVPDGEGRPTDRLTRP